LYKPRILPGRRPHVCHAGMERQDLRTRGAVLQACERSIEKSLRPRASMQMSGSLSEGTRVLPID